MHEPAGRLAALRRWLGIELIAVSKVERLVAAIGGTLAVLVLYLVSHWALEGHAAMFMVASMGATSLLLFAVPHGPLSQPWSVIMGQAGSALIGVTCARFIPQPAVAAGCAVGLTIAFMHTCKCIHPPGGATALTAVIGGESVHSLGYAFVVTPVLLNVVIILALGIAINGLFPWRRYPAAWNRTSRKPAPAGPTHEEIVAAVRSIDSFVDISEEDLAELARRLQRR